MHKLKQIVILSLLLSVSFHFTATAQYTSKKIKSKHQLYTDSLKQVNYDYIFPILGQGAYKKGFDIPYPVGIMANFMWMKQHIIIDNLQLGLLTDNQDIPLTEVDFIEFGIIRILLTLLMLGRICGFSLS